MMNKNIFFIFICFLIGVINIGWTNISESKKVEILPNKAFIIFTEEGWGCLAGQEIKEYVTDLISNEDEKITRLDEIKNPEDSNDRNELCIYFPAKEINGLSGYYILKLGIRTKQPVIEGYLLINQARLINMDKKYGIELKAKVVDGILGAALLYGRQPELKTRVEANGIDKINFLKAYEVNPSLGIKSEMIDSNFDKINIEMYPIFLSNSLLLILC